MRDVRRWPWTFIAPEEDDYVLPSLRRYIFHVPVIALALSTLQTQQCYFAAEKGTKIVLPSLYRCKRVRY